MAKLGHSFEVLGLNKNLELIQVFSFINLQWTRRFYSAGQFSIQIPLSQYDKSVKFIYSDSRPEIGEITQVNYVDDGNLKSVYLSGYFVESWMNHRVVYAKGKYTNITSDPGWVVQSGKSEDVARAYFEAFKNISFTDTQGNLHHSILGVDIREESQHRGNNSTRHRLDDYLGNKIYSILKPSNLSPRFMLDFNNREIYMSIVQGKDLTQDNTDGNNPIIFSTAYGNLKNPNILMSSTDYKNSYIVHQTITEGTQEEQTDEIYCYAGYEGEAQDSHDTYIEVSSNVNKSDYETEAEFIEALLEQGHSQLLNNKDSISTEFDLLEGSYEYLTDFDLGDKCSVEIPEIDLSLDAILSSCYEVIKSDGWSMSMDFTIK